MKKKRNRGCYLIAIVSAFGLTVFAEIFLSSGIKMQQNISEKIIRFHVIANSDSREDQELKLAVRDAVGVQMRRKLEGVSDLEESREIVRDNISSIEKTASEVIAAQGHDYPVNASLTVCQFPEKSYGSFTFPAGNYEALELTIGEGKGHNWWCVMYPNLCFQGNLYEIDDAGNAAELQNALSAEEYAAIMESGDYEVRFKILEMLETVLRM